MFIMFSANTEIKKISSKMVDKEGVRTAPLLNPENKT